VSQLEVEIISLNTVIELSRVSLTCLNFLLAGFMLVLMECYLFSFS
jgi:hypothetical protein